MKIRANRLLCIAMGMSAVFAISDQALAGAPAAPINAPTLDEFGLIGLGAMVAVAGLIAVIRRKK
jgi:hypothetical protein